MAQDKRQVDASTARDVDFAQWYTDVCKKAELIDYTSVKGMFIYRPYGYALWENIQAELDRRFKATGHENVYLPVLIPESLLQKEKYHVEGFAPECAWVTVGGSEKLEDRCAIRPTSETLFCEHYANIINSWRDLPKPVSYTHLAGGEKTAPGQQLHGPVVDLLIPGDGVGNGPAGLGEGRRVQDDEVVPLRLLLQRGQQVEHVGGHAVYCAGEAVARRVGPGHLHGGLRHIHGGDVLRPAHRGVQSEGSGVGEAVQHRPAPVSYTHLPTSPALCWWLASSSISASAPGAPPWSE